MSATSPNPKHPKAGLYLHRKLFDGLARFTDLESRIADLPTRQERGDAFEVFVEAYLATQRLYQAKTVWPFAMLPLAVKERFALGQTDVGVDGMFETHMGEFHAYQAKFRTDRPSLTWDELSTFMGLTDQIAERVVITNCNELSSVLSDRRGFYAIRGADLDRLQTEDLEAIRNWLAGSIVEQRRKRPLPRQQGAIDAIIRTFKDYDRATLLMPCGTGKTLVALWVVERLGNQKILVLMPSLALVSQTLHEWLKETRWDNPSFLCVCSDPTVTRRAEDSLVLNQADVDFPVTTKSEAVRSFLERATEGVKVIFSTYQSSRVVAAGMGKMERFDVGIFDEAHKTAGNVETQFSFALQDANLGITKRLFMTATPRHYDVRMRDKEGNAKLIYSMDVPEVYGPVAYRLSFAQAVQDGMICGYKVLISIVTTGMVDNELLRRGTVKVQDAEVNARQVANQLVINEVIRKYGVKKIITFHSSVAAAASFTAHGPEGIESHVPALQAFHVNGTMGSGTRDLILMAFAEGERTLISNARCLTEGVDVPAVDMVAFLSPKRSLVDIVQATGRAMRKSERTNKTIGYVLVPLFVEQAAGETIDKAVARADFEEIWTVLQALQEHDEVLAQTLAHMRDPRRMVGNFDRETFGNTVEFLGTDVPLNILHDSLTTRILDGLSLWEAMFNALSEFKEKQGGCDVPLAWPDNPQLGKWVESQRVARRRGWLNENQIRRLNDIGFTWESSWEAMFEALHQYKKKHGHCDVMFFPGDKPIVEELSNWTHKQRLERRHGRLTEGQITRLNKIGFEWYR